MKVMSVYKKIEKLDENSAEKKFSICLHLVEIDFLATFRLFSDIFFSKPCFRHVCTLHSILALEDIGAVYNLPINE